MSKKKTYSTYFLKFIKCALALAFTLSPTLNSIQAQNNWKDSVTMKIAQYRSEKSFYQKDTIYIDLINSLGNELRYYKSDSLLIMSQEALTLSLEANYAYGQCKALLNFGDYYSDKGKSEKAVENFSKALELAKSMKDESLVLRIQNELGSEYSYKGDYARALEIYLISLEMAESHDNMTMLSVMNENIANLYASQKDYDQALVYFKKTTKLNVKIDNPIFTAETTSNMASVYAEMGELEYAMFHINRSIAVFERHEIMDWLAYVYEIKGKTYLKKKNYKWALHWYHQSEMLHKDLEDTRAEISLLNGMAEAFLGNKQDSVSQTYALRAFEKSNAIKYKDGIKKCAKTLYEINKNKEDFASALHYHEIYEKHTAILSSSDNHKSLSMLKTQVNYENQKNLWKIKNQKAKAEQRYYVCAALIILLVFLTVTVLVRRSEKIQRGLYSELSTKQVDLEKRESELEETNETKDKLFSIIGHDLRGPIGAFQGLLKLFKDGELSQKEFLDFIPKLHNDIDHISFTLNNLLSWGQSQMNGLKTKPSQISVDTLVKENINLLSELAEIKGIRLICQLPNQTMAWSDGDQIDIVIRNLISNALKFTPENGIVTISAIERNEYLEISVNDTGIGIDAETKSKLFDDNSTVTTYGTNNEKGTGLGLSLCKEMVEKNNGTIWVESKLNKGTTFYFTLIKSSEKYKKAS